MLNIKDILPNINFVMTDNTIHNLSVIETVCDSPESIDL